MCWGNTQILGNFIGLSVEVINVLEDKDLTSLAGRENVLGLEKMGHVANIVPLSTGEIIVLDLTLWPIMTSPMRRPMAEPLKSGPVSSVITPVNPKIIAIMSEGTRLISPVRNMYFHIDI